MEDVSEIRPELYEEGAGSVTNLSAPNGTVHYVDYEYVWKPEVIQRVTTLAIIMFMTLVGNIMIIHILTCRKYRKRSSRVNIYIINLAIGDLTVCLVTMTSEMLFVCFGEWILGPVACKLIVYGQVITLASTTFILTAMSFDRYLAICRPMKFSNSSSRARKMIAVSWVMAFVFALPQPFIFVQTDEGVHPDGSVKHGCKSEAYTAIWQRKLYFTFFTIYILVIPAILVTFFYANVVRVVWRQGKDCARSSGAPAIRRAHGDKTAIPRAKVRTIKMTLCIIISFVLCWSSYFIVTLVEVYSDKRVKIPQMIMSIVETLCLFQSATNPILYGCFNLRPMLCDFFCPSRSGNKRGSSFHSGMTECNTVSIQDTNGVVTVRGVAAADKFRGRGVCIPLTARTNGNALAGPPSPTYRDVSAPVQPSPASSPTSSVSERERRDSFSLHVRRLSRASSKSGREMGTAARLSLKLRRFSLK